MKNKKTKSMYKRWTTKGQEYIFLAKDLDDAKDYAKKVNINPDNLVEVKEDGKA